MSTLRTQWDKEELNSIVLIIYDESSAHNCMIRIAPKLSRPEFSSRRTGCIKNELICGLV